MEQQLELSPAAQQKVMRLAYAIILNKAQGQEGKSILFEARDPPFTMGHAYVGLS